MFRAAAACLVTSGLTVLVVAGTGLGRTDTGAQSVQAPVGESIHFAANDLLCINEAGGHGGRFRTAGVACSSDAEPYREPGLWVTPRKIVITAPATQGGRILYTLKR